MSISGRGNWRRERLIWRNFIFKKKLEDTISIRVILFRGTMLVLSRVFLKNFLFDIRQTNEDRYLLRYRRSICIKTIRIKHRSIRSNCSNKGGKKQGKKKFEFIFLLSYDAFRSQTHFRTILESFYLLVHYRYCKRTVEKIILVIVRRLSIANSLSNLFIYLSIVDCATWKSNSNSYIFDRYDAFRPQTRFRPFIYLSMQQRK